MKYGILIGGLAAWALCAGANEVPFVEEFSLAENREGALKQLIPGTEDYYYYHCLHYQHTEQFAKVDEMLKLWIKRYKYTARVQEIRNRQALLLYDKNPQRSLKHIRDHLGLLFNHQKIELDKEVRLPTALDQNLISHATLAKQAFSERRNLSYFEDSGFDFLVRAQLNPDQRRHLLSRLRRPDYPELPKMIVEDLRYKSSRGFSSHPVHATLLLDQLEACLKLMPELIKNTNFINTYLSKLQPSNDVDWQRDAKETDAFLKRLEGFVRRLPPVQNSLKAHVLYQRLLLNQKQNVFDQDLFMEYIKLPRNAFYVNRDYLKRKEFQGAMVQLGTDFRAYTFLPPVGKDEPLVRRHLMHFLRNADTADAYNDYIEHNYLRDLFAETKMVNGIGDMEQWYSLLSPAKVRELKERVDIEILPFNSEFIADAVTVHVAIKNVEKLIVKTFEINTQLFYRDSLTELTTAIDLDGLVANVEQTFTYEQVSLRRHTERFEFPHIRNPGVYVIELIGNGISSRALVRKGRLTFAERLGSAGHVFTVYDEDGKRLNDASLWLSGHEYTADEHGEIALPFSNRPGQQQIVISHGEFSVLGNFMHQAENYALRAGFYAERESLLDGETCRVLIRPELTVTGIRVDIALLQEVALTIQSTDLEGISSTKEIKGLELENDEESVYEFKVPEGLAALSFVLRGKVQNLSGNKKLDLVTSQSVTVNSIDRTEKTEDLHLRQSGDGFRVELLGKSGEARPDGAVHFAFKHRDFTRNVNVTLKTTPNGQIALGELKGIVRVTARGPQATTHSWQIRPDLTSVRPVVHGLAGEPIAIPYMGPAVEQAADVVSLLEVRGNTFVYNRIAGVAIADGFILLDDLAAGDYDLFIKPENRHVTVRLTAGRREGAQLISRDRVLEQRAGLPVQIAQIETGETALKIRIRNATLATRVHVVARRFMSDRSVFDSLGVPSPPAPRTMRLRRPKSQYLSGRNIGDEYRYILKRRYARKYPGNMLRRPSLLLNPWSLRKTDTGVAHAQGGEAWGQLATDEAQVQEGVFGGRSGKLGQLTAEAAAFANLDFLPSATAVLENLRPDQEGIVVVPYETLGGGQHIYVMAISADSAVVRQTALQPSGEEFQDRRLTRILNPERHFTEQKNISVARAKKVFVIDDVRTSKIELYDSLSKVYRLYATLSGNATLTEFGFILGWPDLKLKAKRKLYSKFACHELSLYLQRKDPEFFKTVILPYLANKKDQTFIDHWLLGADLSDYLKPWAYQRLNIVERALLAQRIEGEGPHAARHVKDLYDLTPPDIERFNHLFKTALKAGALEAPSPGLDFAGYAAAAEMEMGALADADMLGAKLSAVTKAAQPAPRQPAARAAREMPAEAKRKLAQLKEGAEELDRLKKNANALSLENRESRARDQARRSQTRQYYRKLDQTEEWVENNYYHLPIEQQVASLVPVNAYWKDYAAHTGDGAYLSPHVAESSRSFTDMMLALGALDLAHKSGEHAIERKGARLELIPANDIIVYHKEIREVADAGEVQVILVSQNFFAHDDRYRHENNERFDKFVTDEFRVARVYGCQVVLTNPTSTRRKVDVLLQIPEGALPVLNGFYTRSLHRQLEPYSTQALEYYFYFPSPGDYRHYPVHVAQNEELIAHANPFVFNVKKRLSKIDTEAWPYVSQHGTPEQVTQYLQNHNVDRLELNLVAFRMRDKEFFGKVIALLTQRHTYNDTLWSYGIYHNDVAIAREYLPHTAFAAKSGLAIESALLTLDPVMRHAYQHKEYWPLVNARVYQLGKKRKILNRQFHDQYHQFLRVLQYLPSLDDDARMVTAIYLLLQDRVEEAVGFFGKIEPKAIHTNIQYDYLKAYTAFCSETPAVARELATPYKDHPVARWRNLFGDVLAQLDEIEGKAARVVDDEDRRQRQTKLADTAPGLEVKVENRTVTIRYQNLESCTVNFYRMDIELLFSKQPFVQEIGGRFTMIRPNESLSVKLPKEKLEHELSLPKALRDSNVMIEVSAAGITRMQAYYPHSLGLQMLENYGQLRVTEDKSGKALSKVYVKVYARMQNGQVRFFKDGYTDLRGRFDYTSLNTDEIGQVTKFSMLIMSEKHGALIREATPPKM